jgi:3-hydroxyisobutyrate dehydrogenase
MGVPMARNLARSGMDVRAWNRTAGTAQALATAVAGITAAETPADAATGADVVLTMLFDADAVHSAMTGSDGALETLPSGAIWLQMSTVGVDGEARLAALARERAASYVDAPVLGTRAPAEQGALIVLASGPDGLRERCDEVLAPLSQRVFWLGPAGAGSRLKMVANSWVLALTAAMGEAIALAEGLDVDPRVFLELIEGHPTDSPYARTKANAMLSREFPASFPVSGALKDARLVARAMTEAGVEARVGQAVAAQFAAAETLGHGQDDMAAVYWAAAAVANARGGSE